MRYANKNIILFIFTIIYTKKKFREFAQIKKKLYLCGIHSNKTILFT